MRKVLLVAATVLAACFVASIRVPAAAAYGYCPAGDVVVNVTQTVVNDSEVGLAGNVWAQTSYRRQIVVVRLGGKSFCVWVGAAGSFVTNAGISPAATGFVSEGVTGVLSANSTTRLWAKFRPAAPTTGDLGSVDAADADWLRLYFDDVSSVATVAWFKGFAAPDHGTWITRSNYPAFGDITG